MQVIRLSFEVESEATWSRYPGIDDDVLWLPYEEYTSEDANEVRKKSIATVKVTGIFLNGGLNRNSILLIFHGSLDEEIKCSCFK